MYMTTRQWTELMLKNQHFKWGCINYPERILPLSSVFLLNIRKLVRVCLTHGPFPTTCYYGVFDPNTTAKAKQCVETTTEQHGFKKTSQTEAPNVHGTQTNSAEVHIYSWVEKQLTSGLCLHTAGSKIKTTKKTDSLWELHETLQRLNLISILLCY